MRKLGALVFTIVLTSFLISDHNSRDFPTEAEVQQAIKGFRSAGLLSPAPMR